MLLTFTLALHITLAVSVFGAFLLRYIITFKNKAYPKTGRRTLLAGSIGLVVSGVLLAGVDHLPITGLCLDSLGLVVALLVLEFGLQKLAKGLAVEKVKNHNE